MVAAWAHANTPILSWQGTLAKIKLARGWRAIVLISALSIDPDALHEVRCQQRGGIARDVPAQDNKVRKEAWSQISQSRLFRCSERAIDGVQTQRLFKAQLLVLQKDRRGVVRLVAEHSIEDALERVARLNRSVASTRTGHAAIDERFPAVRVREHGRRQALAHNRRIRDHERRLDIGDHTLLLHLVDEIISKDLAMGQNGSLLWRHLRFSQGHQHLLSCAIT